MTSDHEFVQNVQDIKCAKNAVMMLFDQNQINDIKRLCCKDSGSILNNLQHTWTDIVVGERKERERAIRNMGNYKLASTHIHHDIPITTWASLTSDGQDAKLRRLRANPGKITNTITSTNGLRSQENAVCGKKTN